MDINYSDKIKVITDQSIADHLGECPIWNHVEQILYWEDLVRGILRSYCPKTKLVKSYPLTYPGGFIVNSEKGELISGHKTGLVRLTLEPNFKEEKIEVYPLEGKEDKARFNDGKCDWQGRIWFGTADIKLEEPHAEYFMLDSHLKLHNKEQNITIFNGPTFSLDSKYYFFADSPKQTIYRCDLNKETGELSNKIDYFKIDQGFPDGATIDSEGNLWWAIYDGSRILKISTKEDKGKLIGQINVPITNPSSVCFGGENLDKLFVTSISYQSFFEKQLDFPNGGVLEIDMSSFGVKGVKEAFFKEF